MLLRIEPRPEPSRLMRYLSPLLAVALMLICGMVLFLALGKSPVEGFKVFFIQPMADRYGVAELFLKATPLMLCAVGLSVGFRGNVWNIGAEGQLLVGALAGGGVALYFPHTHSFLLLPAMFVAGALGGMLWAAIPAWLRTRFNANARPRIATTMGVTTSPTKRLPPLFRKALNPVNTAFWVRLCDVFITA